MSDYFSQQHMNSNFMNDLMSFLSSYNSFLMVFLIPLFALTTKIAFRKWGHNYYEHIVMNAYILSFYTLVSIIIVYPIMFFFRHSTSTFFNITQFSLLLVPIILVWFFREFYKDKPLKSIIIKVLGVLGLTILGYIPVSYTHLDVYKRQGFIILKPKAEPRKNWEKAFKKMHENGDDQLLIDDVFEDENFDEWN